MRNRVHSILITTFVTCLHVLLAWGLMQIPFNTLEFDEISNLQMVEVNLGVEAPSVEVAPEPEPEPEPEPVVKEEITTTEVPEPVADLVKEEPKIEPPPKVEPPKKKPEPKPKKVEKKPKEKKEVKVAKKAEKPTASQGKPTAEGPIGKENGVAGSSATQGNGHTNASLGAGYGKAMVGRCSDISDEADDEGSVKLKVAVAESGKASSVEVIGPSGIKRLDNQAKRIASSHIYSPARSNGKAVAGLVIFTMNFKCGSAA